MTLRLSDESAVHRGSAASLFPLVVEREEWFVDERSLWNSMMNSLSSKVRISWLGVVPVTIELDVGQHEPTSNQRAQLEMLRSSGPELRDECERALFDNYRLSEGSRAVIERQGDVWSLLSQPKASLFCDETRLSWHATYDSHLQCVCVADGHVIAVGSYMGEVRLDQVRAEVAEQVETWAPKPESDVCPPGRKVCCSCNAVSFETQPKCPACGAEVWWAERAGPDFSLRFTCMPTWEDTVVIAITRRDGVTITKIAVGDNVERFICDRDETSRLEAIAQYVRDWRAVPFTPGANAFTARFELDGVEPVETWHGQKDSRATWVRTVCDVALVHAKTTAGALLTVLRELEE